MKKRTIKLHAPPPANPALIGPPPDWLGTNGKAKWIETVAILNDDRPLEPVDGDFLAMYCEAHDELHRARATLKRKRKDECIGPNGALYPHPAIGQKNKAIERIRKFGRELGLSRSSRKSTKPRIMPQGKQKPA